MSEINTGGETEHLFKIVLIGKSFSFINLQVIVKLENQIFLDVLRKEHFQLIVKQQSELNLAQKRW